MSADTFDVWPHDPTKIVKEALREYVGDGDGEDERVLAAHEERVRAEERERIARNIEAAEWFTFDDEDVEPGEEFIRRADAARIVREGS